MHLKIFEHVNCLKCGRLLQMVLLCWFSLGLVVGIWRPFSWVISQRFRGYRFRVVCHAAWMNLDEIEPNKAWLEYLYYFIFNKFSISKNVYYLFIYFVFHVYIDIQHYNYFKYNQYITEGFRVQAVSSCFFLWSLCFIRPFIFDIQFHNI